MSKKSSVANVETIERRKHWRDRRVNEDRRNQERLRLISYDCRDGLPRRAADLAGELVYGEVWWNKGVSKYE